MISYDVCLLCGFFNAGECGVNHDATAVFANDDFFVHADFHLLLRWNAVEASSTGITLNVHDTKAVAGILADTLECCESALVNFGFEIFGFSAESFFFLACFAYYFVKLALLFAEDVLKVGKTLACCLNVGLTIVDGA